MITPTSLITVGCVFSLACVQSKPTTVASVDADALPELRLEAELRIGSRDSVRTGFTYIQAVDVGPNHHVYVLDAVAQDIRSYDTTGQLLHVIGNKGKGPGEFANIVGFGVHNDTVWVSDDDNLRLSYFTTDATLVRTVASRPVTVVVEKHDVRIFTRPALRLHDGTWRATRYSMGFSYKRHPRQVAFPIPRLVFNSDGAVVDTAGYQTIRVAGWPMTVRGEDLPGERLLQSEPLLIERADGSAIVDQPVARSSGDAVFAVTFLSEVSDTILVRGFRYTPLSVNDAFINALAKDLAVGGEPALGSEGPTVVRDNSPEAARLARTLRSILPRQHPPVSDYVAGKDGQLWLRREDTGEENFRWLIVKDNGDVRGHVELPRNAVVHWIKGDQAWIEVHDEVDVPWLVRYRIVANN